MIFNASFRIAVGMIRTLLIPKFTIWEDAFFVWRVMNIDGKLFFHNVFQHKTLH